MIGLLSAAMWPIRSRTSVRTKAHRCSVALDFLLDHLATLGIVEPTSTGYQTAADSSQSARGHPTKRTHYVAERARNAASSRSGLMFLVYRGPQGVVASRIARSSRSWPGW